MLLAEGGLHLLGNSKASVVLPVLLELAHGERDLVPLGFGQGERSDAASALGEAAVLDPVPASVVVLGCPSLSMRTQLEEELLLPAPVTY